MIKTASSQILAQIIDVTSNLNNAQYSASLPILNNSSIGKHVRHIIEFYQCLLKGYETGIVDYDAREHDLLLENDNLLAVLVLKAIKEQLHANDEKALTLLVNFSETNSPVTVSTTYNRELIYNIEHVVHHAAIIKIALKNIFPDVHIPENFGIAYSTVKYNKQREEKETANVG